MKEYIKSLIEQFRLANGINAIDTVSEEFLNEFHDWLRERQRTARAYTYLLDDMEFNYQDQETAEVGKGDYDTVVKSFDTTLITPSSQVKTVSPCRVIDGYMKVCNGRPILRKSNETSYIPLFSSNITTYMTQNPYSLTSIEGWNDLHNSGKYGIILGMFGNEFDMDKDKKIKFLKEFKSKLDSYDLLERYETMGNSWYYVIGTEPINDIKRNILTR